MAEQEPPCVEVIIEIPRGSFLKRGSNGEIDFVSPIPCPYNYGSVRDYIGGEGDYLDAVVLGPRLRAGTRVVVRAFGAVGLSERNMYDDKLICGHRAPSAGNRRNILRFFRLYSFCKGIYNRLRGQSGHASCEGWGRAADAIARAVPVSATRPTPRIRF